MDLPVLAAPERPSGLEAPQPGAGALDAILKPRSVAVIGASRDPNSIGHQVLANLIRYGFTGAVYPVNPKATSVHSVKAWPSVAAIRERVDLAVIAVPREQVPGVAEECGRSGVRGLVVISAGFKETGPAGAAAEARLLQVARKHGMRLVGPNCMGVLNGDPAVSLNATFAPTMPPYGQAGFVSQSGALGVSVLDYAREYGIGIAQFVSMGNKADVSGSDVLLQWEHDPAVGVILMYVENFGNPRRFLEIASRITKTKPIIVVKSGRSKVGARGVVPHRRARGERHGRGGAAGAGGRASGRLRGRAVRHGDGLHGPAAAAVAPDRRGHELGRARDPGGRRARDAGVRARGPARGHGRAGRAPVSARGVDPQPARHDRHGHGGPLPPGAGRRPERSERGLGRRPLRAAARRAAGRRGRSDRRGGRGPSCQTGARRPHGARRPAPGTGGAEPRPDPRLCVP